MIVAEDTLQLLEFVNTMMKLWVPQEADNFLNN
jgi:hypothetical protein